MGSARHSREEKDFEEGEKQRMCDLLQSLMQGIWDVIGAGCVPIPGNSVGLSYHY